LSGALVHLIDAPVYVFRAYHSLPDMRAPDGTPTGAAYGFTNSLLKWLREARPSHVAVTFDFSMESFRNAIEPGYKAQRGEPPDDLAPQFGICAEVSRALGLQVFEQPDYEADDLIATLATQLARRGARSVVMTTDKDLAQLVREDGRVVLYDLARGETRDADAVRAVFGVDPAQIPDWLGLVGDAVDNLPGVPGVGPVGASAALRAFGSIERIPADPGAWSRLGVRGAARLAARIDAHRERALRTRALATLVRDVPGVRADLRRLRWRGADRSALEPLLACLGWGRIATRVPLWGPGRRKRP
jgi:5'-3' exonuclease